MAAPARRLDWQFQLLDLKILSRTLPALVPPPPPVESGESDAVRQLRATLAASVKAKVLSGAELIRHLAKATRETSLPTTIDAVDTLLGGGLRRGKVVELVSRRATGRFSIVMATLAAATSIGEAAALIDLGDHFDPQLAEASGIDLRRLLWIRPQTLKQAVMATEMITATGFQLVVLDVGLHPLRGKRAPDAAWIRLARSAEVHGTAMLVTTPYQLTGTASEAVIKGERTNAKWIGRSNSPRLLAGVDLNLTLEKHRHIRPGTRTNMTLAVPDSALNTQHSALYL